MNNMLHRTLLILAAGLVVAHAASLPGDRKFIPIPTRTPPHIALGLAEMDSPRIVGGDAVDISTVPYQVAILAWNQFFCGGSIISSTVVLTAAHCTHDQDMSEGSIRAGSNFSVSLGQQVNVVEVVEHPNYNSAATDYDVCILFLDDQYPITFNTRAQPVQLAKVGQVTPDGTSAVVSGWGRTVNGGPPSPVLRAVTVPKQSDANCKAGYNKGAITPRMVCYGPWAGGQDSCQGDSGGPLVVNGVQVGVVSFGGQCAAAGHPGVYADLSNWDLRSFIQQQTGI